MPSYIDIGYITGRVDDNDLFLFTSEAGDSAYDSTAINSMIDDAEALINSYLSKRYVTPLAGDNITPLVKRLTFDIAMYNISGMRGQNQPFADLYERYKTALRVLTAIRNGEQELVGATALQATSGLEVILSTSETDTRHFKKENFSSYKPSDEWL